MQLTYKNRVVVIEDVHGQYEDDIQFSANYLDNDEEVDDDGLYFIETNYAADIYEVWIDNKIGEAECLYEE